MSTHPFRTIRGVLSLYVAYLLLPGTLLVALGVAGCGDGRTVDVPGGSVSYTDKVQEAEAKKLADYLVSRNYFNEKRDRVQIDKTDNTYTFRTVVSDGQENNPAYLIGVKNLSLELSKRAFNDAPVAIELCDENFKTIKPIKPTYYGKRLGFNGGDLYFAPTVSLAEAKRLGAFLVQDSYFKGDGATVQLAKSGPRYAFRIMVKPNLYRDTTFIRQCQGFGHKISRVVFNNAPVDIHLCNALYKTVTIVRSDGGATTQAQTQAKPNP
jgi:hypothetical protein